MNFLLGFVTGIIVFIGLGIYFAWDESREDGPPHPKMCDCLSCSKKWKNGKKQG